MSDRIRKADIDAYNTDGVVPLRGLINSADVEKLQEAVEDNIRTPGPFFHGYESDEGSFHGNLRLWETHQAFRDMCVDSALPEIARTFFGANTTNRLYDQLIVKEALMSRRTRWHNDQPYWPIPGWQLLAIRIALDKTTVKNGRVEFVRGSHKWHRWFQPEVFDKTAAITQYERNPDFEDIPNIQADRDRYDIISGDLEPGDAVVFHGLTVHGAAGN